MARKFKMNPLSFSENVVLLQTSLKKRSSIVLIKLFLLVLNHIRTNFTSLNKYIFLFYFSSVLLSNDSWMVYDDSEVATINIEIHPQTLSWIYDSANLESDSMHVASVHFQNAYINEHIDSIGFRIRGHTSRNAD